MLYQKNGIVRDRSRIVVDRDGYKVVNPTDEMIAADGWTPYEPAPYEPVETIDDQLRGMLLDQYNGRTDIADMEALKRPLLVYSWDSYVGKSLAKGQIVSHGGELWRVRQDVSSVLEGQEPSMDTAALYEVVEVEASGTKDEPIPYTPPMEIFSGKYYTQGGVIYLCTRDSGQALSHDLSALVGLYVEIESD